MSPPHIARDLIPKLTCDREFGLGGMIRGLSPARPSKMTRSPLSSLGQLDLLPTELLLITLSLLDFQSLSRISRISLRGKCIVEALPAYKDMMEHAPETLTALGKTRLLHHHSALLLHKTLRSDKCVSCFNFGGFLFLPACERVCASCLYENIALRMTTPTIAKQCFGLTDKQLQRIPILYSIPGTYNMWLKISRKRVYRLVSVKQAKQLAIEIHGSAENVAKLMPSRPSPGMTERRFDIFRQFHQASLEPPGCDLSRLPYEHVVGDDYFAMASIRFPFLTDAGAYNGRVCRGCLEAAERHAREVMPEVAMPEIVPPGVGPAHAYLGLMLRLHSEEGFFQHIQTCCGVKYVLNNEQLVG